MRLPPNAPGHKYSYTNNWPAEPRVDNGPTARMIVWSALSLVALLGSIGVMFAVYGRWSQQVGWHSAEASNLSFRRPGEVSLTPAQRACICFFEVVSVLFLAQTLLGAAAEHYRADLSTFFDLDLARVLPYKLARTWHLQLSLFWTAAAFLAGIFLVPFISHREPKHQGLLAYLLLGAVAVVVGLLSCEALSTYGVIPHGYLSQQWEYSRPAAAVADPADRRAVRVDRGHLARHAHEAQGRVEDEHALVVLHSPGWRSRRSTRWGCWPAVIRISPSPTFGGSGWCTCGARISSSCSPR